MVRHVWGSTLSINALDRLPFWIRDLPIRGEKERLHL